MGNFVLDGVMQGMMVMFWALGGSRLLRKGKPETHQRDRAAIGLAFPTSGICLGDIVLMKCACLGETRICSVDRSDPRQSPWRPRTAINGTVF